MFQSVKVTTLKQIQKSYINTLKKHASVCLMLQSILIVQGQGVSFLTT